MQLLIQIVVLPTRYFSSCNLDKKQIRVGQSFSKSNGLFWALFSTLILPVGNFENSQGNLQFCAHQSIQAQAMRQGKQQYSLLLWEQVQRVGRKEIGGVCVWVAGGGGVPLIQTRTNHFYFKCQQRSRPLQITRIYLKSQNKWQIREGVPNKAEFEVLIKRSTSYLTSAACFLKLICSGRKKMS